MSRRVKFIFCFSLSFSLFSLCLIGTYIYRIPLLVGLFHSTQFLPAKVFSSRMLLMVGEPAIPHLVFGLSSPNADVRVETCDIFNMFGSSGSAAIPSLLPLLRDGHKGVRHHALNALGSVISYSTSEKGKDDLVVEAFTQTLKNDDVSFHREMAARKIGNLGSRAAFALPTLIVAVIADPDPLVRCAAARALVKVSPGRKEVLETFVKALQDEAASVREAAVYGLAWVEQSSEVALLSLSQALNDADKDVREAAAWAIEEIKARGSRP